jgi:ribosomal protein S21
MIHIDITPTNNENPANMLRRFTKLVRSSAIVNTVKSNRYYNRENSIYKTKLSALRRIANTKIYNHKLKMGKIVERDQGPRRQHAPQTTTETQTTTNETK